MLRQNAILAQIQLKDVDLYAIEWKSLLWGKVRTTSKSEILIATHPERFKNERENCTIRLQYV